MDAAAIRNEEEDHRRSPKNFDMDVPVLNVVDYCLDDSLSFCSYGQILFRDPLDMQCSESVIPKGFIQRKEGEEIHKSPE